MNVELITPGLWLKKIDGRLKMIPVKEHNSVDLCTYRELIIRVLVM